MTLNDIKNEVSALCFLGELALDDSFVFSVNRALRSIYTEKGVSRILTLHQSPPRVFKSIANIKGGGDEKIEYTLPRGTFSIVISGEGVVEFISEDEARTYPFTSHCEHICGYSDKEFTLSFSSSYTYTIHMLWHTEEHINAKDLPNLSFNREYKLSERISDFLGAHGLPTDEYGRVIKGSKIVSGVLYVPYGYEGIINLEYKITPPYASIDFPDLELDIPNELLHLVPLLSASYVVLDDDEERSAYYLSLYRNALSALISYDTARIDSSYADRLGWC